MVHANAKVERVGGRNPAREARLTVRAGKHRGHTSGMAPGYVQGNLVNGGAVLSEDVAAIEVTVLIEVVMERGMDRSELLKGLHVPEIRHRTLSSSERLV